jgi:hypothetical protein
MTTALEICERNTAGLSEKRAADKARLRADMPLAVALVEECVKLLVEENTRPKLPPFNPRVMMMTEGDKTWTR